MNRQFKREWLIGTIIVLMFVGVGTVARASDEVRVRWDLIHVILGTCLCATPGGSDSAMAPDKSQITMTGSGTFHISDGGFEDVTGGGTWQTHDASNVMTGSGTYRVTGVVNFTHAPGIFPPPLNDLVGNKADASAGLMVLRIAYSDGSRGILVLNCTIVGTPSSIAEGITATKGFVNFSTQGTAVDTVDANHTLFHVQTTEE